MSRSRANRSVHARVIGVAAGVGVVVGVASVAWACTTFVRVNLSVSAGAPGTEILVTGQDATPSSQVVLRWDSRTAPQTANVMADADGKFVVPVKAPEAAGGVHVLLATDSKGQIARGAFEISSGGALSSEPGFRTGPAPAQPTDWLRLGANLLGFGLAGAVSVLGIAVLRRRPVPVTVRGLPAEG